MDYLPIQASAVPCERVFSSAKETVTARRNRISSDLMEALQVLKYFIVRGRSISFTDGMDKEARSAWSEHAAERPCWETRRASVRFVVKLLYDHTA